MAAKTPMTARKLKNALERLGYDFTPRDRDFVVFTSKNLTKTRDELAQMLRGRNVPTLGKIPAHVNIDGFKVFVRPPSEDGVVRAAGASNEDAFIDLIESTIKQYGVGVSVQFTDGHRSMLVKGIKAIHHSARDTRNRKKADAIIVGDRTHRISLKQHNADRWESADTYWREKGLHYLQMGVREALINLSQAAYGYTIDPNLAIEATTQEMKDVVFGSDITTPNDCVIRETFNKEATRISYDSVTNTITIEVTKVILTSNDVEEDEYPWFVFQNDKGGRKIIEGYPGIRIVAYTKKRAFQGRTQRIPLSKRDLK